MLGHNQSEDKLGLLNEKDKELIQVFNEEKLIFSDAIIKINRFNMSQDRNILITNKAIYNLKKTNIKRKIEIKNIIGITVAAMTDEFVIHGSELEYDYDYVSANRTKIIKIIAQQYKETNGKEIKLCKVEEKYLKNYVTSKKEKKKDLTFSRMDVNHLVDINTFLAESEAIDAEYDNNLDQRKKKRNNTLYSRHKEIKQVCLEDFKVLKVIGRGSYGKVMLVEYIHTHECYAMKSLKKDVLLDEDQVESTLLEKKILEKVDHPFLVGMVFCFQTEERIYFVMPFIRGGELFQHLKNFRFFDEEKVRLYAAMIGLGLAHIHKHGIIYRDIKPENILMDEEGYLKIADFGMAKILIGNEKANSFCGTPEYLSPEIILGTGHNKSADWWSYGILIFEMLFGIPPFYCDNNERMYQLIIHSELKFPKKITISDNAKDFIKKLLNKNQEKRLGSKNDFDEMKIHPWFDGLNWDDLLAKKIKAPFIPVLNDKLDTQNFDQEFTSEEIVTSVIPEKGLQNIKENQDKFAGFDH